MERRKRNFLVILIAVVIAIAVFASFGLPLFYGPTPEIVLPTPLPTGQNQVEESGQGGGVRVEVTPATVQSVIAAMSRLESYFRTVTTTLEGTSVTAQVWVDDGWTRTDLTLPTGRVAHTIVGDGTVWRWYDGEREARSWSADRGAADVEGQRIPTYEDVIDLAPETITAAGYEEKNGMDCVYIGVEVAEPAQVERYWVSADNGLLVAAETEIGDEVVWSMTATAPEIPVSASASFALPDGTVCHTVGVSFKAAASAPR